MKIKEEKFGVDSNVPAGRVGGELTEFSLKFVREFELRLGQTNTGVHLLTK